MAIPPELSGEFNRANSQPGRNSSRSHQPPPATNNRAGSAAHSGSPPPSSTSRRAGPASVGGYRQPAPPPGQSQYYYPDGHYPPSASGGSSSKVNSPARDVDRPMSERRVARVPEALWGAANYPLAPARPAPGYRRVEPVDRLDFFLHAVGLGGLAALGYGAWLTQSAFNGSAGWIVAASLTLGQAYFRRVGWTPLNMAGFALLLFLDTYFNLLGLIRDRHYTFDFQPLAGVLWKSTDKIPQVITSFEWTVYLIVSLMIAALAEPALLYWWARIRGRQ